ncbi:hypothetical protein [Haladaptatus pallidirubidus]|uniref:hypothetical protein n=1 Tax=Haladaptatus pallidirubidus TaxID=1008152 RepID=UPI001D0FBB2E|nr:hypothetical protein [Haladaptatus pallidirubidus]
MTQRRKLAIDTNYENKQSTQPLAVSSSPENLRFSGATTEWRMDDSRRESSTAK